MKTPYKSHAKTTEQQHQQKRQWKNTTTKNEKKTKSKQKHEFDEYIKVKKRHKNPCAKRGLLQCVSVILVINYLVLIVYITQSVPVIFAKLPCFNCLHYTICTCNFC